MLRFIAQCSNMFLPYVGKPCGKNRRLKRTAVLMTARVVRGIISTFHTDSEVSSFINSRLFSFSSMSSFCYLAKKSSLGRRRLCVD